MIRKFTLLCFALFLLLTGFLSCSKSSDSQPADPCAGKTIAVTAAITNTSSPSTSNGALLVTATGSTGFTYSINNGAYGSINNFTSLPAGTYTIKAKDGAGCEKTQTFTVTATACPTITVTGTATNTSGLGTSDGSINATATGSTGFTYRINSGTFQGSGNFSNLTTGSYVVEAKDANGCTGSATFIVNSATCPNIVVSTVVTQTSGPTATNGSINVIVVGGVSPYIFSIDNGAFVSSNIFNNLPAGTHLVQVRDANGCTGSVNSIVTSAACPSITFNSLISGSDKCTNNTGSITINATGSTGFQYSIDGGVVFNSSNVFNGLSAGVKTIVVKDGNGCSASSTATVTQAPAGVKFSAVKSMMATNCAISGCHSGPSPQNGLNFSDDCTIVAQSARIQARAVNGIGGFMPPTGQLSAADKQKITDWINAGAQHSNN